MIWLNTSISKMSDLMFISDFWSSFFGFCAQEMQPEKRCHGCAGRFCSAGKWAERSVYSTLLVTRSGSGYVHSVGEKMKVRGWRCTDLGQIPHAGKSSWSNLISTANWSEWVLFRFPHEGSVVSDELWNNYDSWVLDFQRKVWVTQQNWYGLIVLFYWFFFDSELCSRRNTKVARKCLLLVL